MANSEKVTLLGAGLYNSIPDELTLTSLPTVSELDMVSSEDFDTTMLDKILPSAVVEKNINFRELLEIDYYWLCRCLRLLNYGPYHTTGTIFCPSCGATSRGSYQVNLETIPVVELPAGFKNELVITKDKFIDFQGKVVLALPTIQQTLNAAKDKVFMTASGAINREFARLCYSIRSIGDRDNLTPMEVKAYIEKHLSPADYKCLKSEAATLMDFGLRAGGTCQCPSCRKMEGRFIALVDDRFFRPNLDNLRAWRDNRNKRAD